ncbi:glycosyltransferase family 1 protein [Streptomyces roseirectus]|uniref:Glycosyltransferase family 1 protein n=1 Tax=Streptomyces roseirectus TaxID=2768066 RepID=A0A7H0ITI1_9ACTN|nr:glycosyltransferase [Streptomyces roseirectus]QNP76097.1 glycosyltransferase family 1 protein [Streptomyces roseirectus]
MTAGSRGDVAPFTGVGHALVRDGHEVTLVTHGRFEALVAGSGVAFHPLPVDPRAELESSRGRGLHRSSSGLGKLARVVRLARSLVGEMADDVVAAARESDALLLSASLSPLGHVVADALDLPALDLPLQPLAATRHFAPPMLGGGSLGPHLNLLAGHVVDRSVDHVFAPALPAVRAQLGVPRPPRRRRRPQRPLLHGFSPLVVPRPSDWRPGLDVTGYWWPYDTAGELPDELRRFLEAGPPPVFIGLGSATVPDPAALSAEIIRALRLAGLRGIVQRGWAGLSAEADDILTIDDVPHSLLFPRMAAVVHHCGAGTTAAGIRAGVPSVPVPIQFDEGFWAARLVSLGVAPQSLTLRKLTAERLAAALTRATTEPEFTERARKLGTQVRAEDGLAKVLEAVNGLS